MNSHCLKIFLVLAFSVVGISADGIIESSSTLDFSSSAEPDLSRLDSSSKRGSFYSKCQDFSKPVFSGRPCERRRGRRGRSYRSCTRYTCADLSNSTLSQEVLGVENFCEHERYGRWFQRACRESCTGCNTIVDVAVANNATFSTLLTVLRLTGLTRKLASTSERKNFTVFAPTDNAFDETLLQGNELGDVLPGDKNSIKLKYLQCILNYHVLPKEIKVVDFVEDATEPTLEGSNVILKTNPNDAVEDAAGELANIDSQLSDVDASNGVIHAIDRVLSPPCIAKDVADIIGDETQFSTLASILDDSFFSDLKSDLSGQNLTLLAPNNGAFAEVDVAGFLENDANKTKLRDILLYHVIPEEYLHSHRIRKYQRYDTALTDKSVEFRRTRYWRGGDIKVLSKTEAEVVMPDILASNGIIHGIDAVLTPPDESSGECEDGEIEFRWGTVSCAAISRRRCWREIVKENCPKKCQLC